MQTSQNLLTQYYGLCQLDSIIGRILIIHNRRWRICLIHTNYCYNPNVSYMELKWKVMIYIWISRIMSFRLG